MLRIGIIGLGDIAQKAYLPLISSRNLDLHLHTRNKKKLSEIGQQYRIANLHEDLGSLLHSGIKAAFVHTATHSHHDIIEQLLLSNIHVFVDKPVTYDYSSTEKLFSLAHEKNLLLHVGFNRRVAPAYQVLKAIKDPNMIIMQKNRKSLPAEIRTFIFDDFIHVVDTLRWIFDKPITQMIVNGKKTDRQLRHVVMQFISADGATALGIMNRDSGTVEERIEVFSASGKRIVNNMVDPLLRDDKMESRIIPDDWQPTLHKRGFDQLIDTFLSAVQQETFDNSLADGALLTHRLCEEITQTLEAL